MTNATIDTSRPTSKDRSRQRAGELRPARPTRVLVDHSDAHPVVARRVPRPRRRMSGTAYARKIERVSMKRSHFEEGHESYRDTVRELLSREIVPHYESWDNGRLVNRSAWVAAGKFGTIGLGVAEQYGGSGVTDYRFQQRL